MGPALLLPSLALLSKLSWLGIGTPLLNWLLALLVLLLLLILLLLILLLPLLPLIALILLVGERVVSEDEALLLVEMGEFVVLVPEVELWSLSLSADNMSSDKFVWVGKNGADITVALCEGDAFLELDKKDNALNPNPNDLVGVVLKNPEQRMDGGEDGGATILSRAACSW